MTQHSEQQQREPWITFQDVAALVGIGSTAAGAHQVWGPGVALMVGGGLMLAAVVAARL